MSHILPVCVIVVVQLFCQFIRWHCGEIVLIRCYAELGIFLFLLFFLVNLPVCVDCKLVDG